jgi:MoaA/NifB/PqqE/SkfB family radical SAM enzyme
MVDENRASPERFGQLCRELKPVVAQVSGGEPLLRQDIEKIVSALRMPQRPPFIALTTNGALLNQKKYQSLRQAGVDEFSLSLDYPDERHDEFRGIPGLFNKITALMKWLNDKPDKGMTLCCVIQSDNYRLLTKMAQLATEWGVMLNFSTYTPMRTHNMDYMLNPDQVKEFEEITKQLIQHGKKYNNLRTSPYAFRKMIEYFRQGQMPKCGTGYKFFNINPDGTFSPCGLIIKDYKTRKELIEKFAKSNTCAKCNTSIRISTEKPARYMLLDNIKQA